MRFLGIQDLRKDLPHYVRAVEGGDEVVITRHGRPVAAMVTLEQVDAFLRQTRKHRDAKLHPELRALAEDLALLIAGKDAEDAWTLLYNAANSAYDKLQQCNPEAAREAIERDVLRMVHEARRRSFRIAAFAKSARA